MKRKVSGFTLLEIAIVVTIIGLLLSMAVPFFKKATLNAKYASFMSDLRTFAGAVETLYLESGSKPVDSNTGSISPELSEYVRENFFVRDTPIGGKWDVEADDSNIGLGVGVDGYTISQEDLAELDRRYDDGDLSTGKLVEIVSNRRYYWIIEL